MHVSNIIVLGLTVERSASGVPLGRVNHAHMHLPISHRGEVVALLYARQFQNVENLLQMLANVFSFDCLDEFVLFIDAIEFLDVSVEHWNVRVLRFSKTDLDKLG